MIVTQSEDNDSAIAVAFADGHAVITGVTESSDFPTRRAWQAGSSGTDLEAFVTKTAPDPVRPHLQITPSGSNLILNWPADAEDFILESSRIPGANWQPVPTQPLLLGIQNAVVTRPSDSAQFFRLKRP